MNSVLVNSGLPLHLPLPASPLSAPDTSESLLTQSYTTSHVPLPKPLEAPTTLTALHSIARHSSPSWQQTLLIRQPPPWLLCSTSPGTHHPRNSHALLHRQPPSWQLTWHRSRRYPRVTEQPCVPPPHPDNTHTRDSLLLLHKSGLCWWCAASRRKI